jgi:hypothetical protein
MDEIKLNTACSARLSALLRERKMINARIDEFGATVFAACEIDPAKYELDGDKMAFVLKPEKSVATS